LLRPPRFCGCGAHASILAGLEAWSCQASRGSIQRSDAKGQSIRIIGFHTYARISNDQYKRVPMTTPCAESREFAPAPAAMRVQVPEVQVARISSALPVRTCRRSQRLQYPASPHIPEDPSAFFERCRDQHVSTRDWPRLWRYSGTWQRSRRVVTPKWHICRS
jgi:hypothetical protein